MIYNRFNNKANTIDSGFWIGHQMLGDVIGFCAAAYLLSKKTGKTIKIFFPQESRKDVCKYFPGVKWVPKAEIPNAIDCGRDPTPEEWPTSNGVKRFYKHMDSSMTNPLTFDVHMNVQRDESVIEKTIGLIVHSHTQGTIDSSSIKFMCYEAKKEYPDHKIVLLGEKNSRFVDVPGIQIEDRRVAAGTSIDDLISKISKLSLLLCPQTGPCFIAAGLKVPMWVYKSKSYLQDYTLNYDTYKVSRWFDRKDIITYPVRKDWLSVCRKANIDFYNKIIDTIGHSNVVIVKRKDSSNIGEFLCLPSLYFNLPVIDVIDIEDKRSINNYLEKNMNFIIGGGGMMYSRSWMKTIESIVNRSPNTIIWGIGKNDHNNNISTYNYPSFFSNAKLVGLRDRDQTVYPWVPCPSCMSDVFDEITPAIQPDVIYSHQHFKIDDTSKTNREFNSMKGVIDYLSLGENVITNSYHGAYWSLLAGRSVTIRNNFSNKILGL